MTNTVLTQSERGLSHSKRFAIAYCLFTGKSLVLLWAVCFFALPLYGSSLDSMLQEANEHLQKGEKAASYEERKISLNQALYLYSLIEQQSTSRSLTQVIGDIYLQLGEYPWAVLYYQKALKEEPHDSLAIARLQMAQHKLGIDVSSHIATQKQGFLKLLTSIAKLNALFFFALFFAFLTCSLTIWFSHRMLRIAAACSSFFLLFLLLNFTVIYYSAPLEGILIAPTGFYRTPGKNQPQLTSLPLFAGSKVNVLQITEKGDWLKITTDEGLIGYIPSSTLKLI